MKKLKQAGIACTLLLLLVMGSSWGFLVHRTTHQLAVYELPNEVQGFFYRHLDYLVKNAPRPDTRRNEDSTEATKHFIDIEYYGKDAENTMPATWDAAVAKYTKDSLLKYGHLPYVIVDMKAKLTHAFATANEDSILFYAADLGHYIGDANVPLHTSINYDGQLSNQKGLHALWESMIPEIEIEQFNLYGNHTATYLANPTAAVWKAIRRSYALVPDVFAKELEVSKQFTEAQKFRIQMRKGKEVKYYTTEFAKAYAASLHNTINEQLVNTSNMIADFWYTCWVDGGKPNMDKVFNTSLTQAETERLKAETESYQKNTLIKDGYLISKKKEQ